MLDVRGDDDGQHKCFQDNAGSNVDMMENDHENHKNDRDMNHVDMNE